MKTTYRLNKNAAGIVKRSQQQNRKKTRRYKNFVLSVKSQEKYASRISLLEKLQNELCLRRLSGLIVPIGEFGHFRVRVGYESKLKELAEGYGFLTEEMTDYDY